MSTTIETQTIVKDEARRFANYLRSYQECTEPIQAIVDEMVEIIVDSESSTEEREHAVEAMIEALFPGLAADVFQRHKNLMKSADFQAASNEVKVQEASFAEKVRELLTQKGMTQEQLAEATGVSQPAISNILNRRCRPQQRTILRIAEGLGVEPTELWKPLED